jgi:hypothetical protein
MFRKKILKIRNCADPVGFSLHHDQSMEKNMRKLVLALAALAAVGLALPVTSSARAEESRVIIKHGDRGLHRGWEHHHAKKVVIIKHRGHHHYD